MPSERTKGGGARRRGLTMRDIPVSEVAEHNRSRDCWLILDGKVYDVSSFAMEHPGGEGLLVGLGGGDASDEFHGMHPDKYLNLISADLLGNAVTANGASPPAPPHAQAAAQPAPAAPANGRDGVSGSSSSAGPEAAAAAAAAAASGGSSGGGPETAPLYPPLPAAAAAAKFAPARMAGKAGVPRASPMEKRKGARRCRGYISPGMAGVPRHFPRKLRFDMERTAAVQEANSSGGAEPRSLDLLLLAKRDLTHNTREFVFSVQPPPPGARGPAPLALAPGQHVYLEKGGITRPYTPVEHAVPNRSAGEDEERLRFVIKIYENGALTRALDTQLQPGDSLSAEVRPFTKFVYQGAGWYKAAANESGGLAWCSDIGLVAGGTGITPVYSIIRKVLSDSADKTRLWLLYANVTPDDILLLPEISRLAAAHPNQLRVWFTVDSVPGGSPPWPYSTGYINHDMLGFLPPSSAEPSAVTLLCGPPPMVGSVKKLLAASHRNIVVL
ncbi:NADH-cytochrome b5 reductase 1 [Diplonema papillatum]|nr:NADH-cytochrome b5 reductase 1 [Diplonema papillatum]